MHVRIYIRICTYNFHAKYFLTTIFNLCSETVYFIMASGDNLFFYYLKNKVEM